MTILVSLFGFLTYTEPPTAEGVTEPSLLWSLIGGWNDIEEIDDAAVRPDRVISAEATPSFLKFKAAIAALPNEEGNDDYKRLFRIGLGLDPWDQSFVLRMLTSYERALGLLDEVLEEGELIFPAQVPGREGGGEEFKCLTFSQVLRTRTVANIKGGAWKEALESLRMLNRYSRVMGESDGNLLHRLLHFACEANTLRVGEEMLNDPSLPPEHLLDLRRILLDAPDPEEAMIESWKQEYAYQKRICGLMEDGLSWESLFFGDLRAENPTPLEEIGEAAWRCLQQANLAFGFQPNRTLRSFADTAEYHIALTELMAEKRRAVPPPKSIAEAEGWRWWLEANWVGGRVSLASLGPGASALDRMDLMVANRRVLGTACAIREYHNLHGELPGSLKDLVPRHLAEVPRDPYDGERMRYSAEEKRLWVVGENLKDEGGLAEPADTFQDRKARQSDPTLDFKWMKRE